MLERGSFLSHFVMQVNARGTKYASDNEPVSEPGAIATGSASASTGLEFVGRLRVAQIVITQRRPGRYRFRF